MLETLRNATAWEQLRPEFRSERIGWSKSGEFYCPHCSTIIGKNLLGERPFLLAAEHVRTHERRHWLTDDEQRRAAQ
jgi:hypothetical protein